MSANLALGLALVCLVATLAAAIVRPPWLPEAVVAVVAAGVLVATGALSLDGARHAVDGLAPTIAFLGALLLIGEGCRRDGVFDALGSIMATGSRGSARRLLALVFVVAAAVTTALGLDSTIVLLTPVVFVTATRLRVNPKPPVYATAHLANSSSLLLPVSNLTNLLAFRDTDLSFIRFASLMALPTVAAIGIEWIVLTRFFAGELGGAAESEETVESPQLPRFAVGVLAATLVGFMLSSPLGINLLWIAWAGAAAMTLPALIRRTATPRALVGALQVPFLLFVLGLGVIVAAARVNGLETAVRSVLPGGQSLLDLLLIVTVSAVLANLVNNLPAILILAPALAPFGYGAVLAALVGVNVGPNMTYVGSLATLLWRRILRAEDTDINLREFLSLGAATVPVTLAVSAVMIWFGMRVNV